MMHYRKVEGYFEILAEIIEKKDGYKKVHEQLGKFLERATYADSTNQTKDIGLVRFGNPKPGDELNRPKGAQVVENGWWLSRNDCRLKFGSTEGKGKGRSKISELKDAHDASAHECGRSGRCVKQVVFLQFFFIS